MKDFLRPIILVAFFATILSSNYAQDTAGMDFWLTYLPNHNGLEIQIGLQITGARACSGTVTNPNTDWSTEFTVTPGLTTTVVIPKVQGYENNSDCILDKGLHVIASDSISVYASNFKTHSFDVTNVIPTPSLGSEYLIQTYPGAQYDYSQFSIVAVEDSTVVDLVLTTNSLYGHNSGEVFSATLNAGQCYQIQSVQNYDMSGSYIRAHDNKKIAVFAGNVCVFIPNGHGYCDHIVEQMMPVTCLGKHFVVTGSCMRSKDVVRVTALNDDCQVFVKDTLMSTLDARQTVEFEINTETPALYLETTEPSIVCLYLTGSSYGGMNGDPSMITINPMEQKINNVVFTTFSFGGTESHFINVVTDSDKVAYMQMDGDAIDTCFQTVPDHPEYAYARIPLLHGPHQLSNPEGGFVAHAYGLATEKSYGYSIGSMLTNISSRMLVDGQLANESPDGFHTCDGTPIEFDLSLDFNLSQANWSFGDGETATGCPVTHSYTSNGQYPVTCDVYKSVDEQDVLMATLTAQMIVHQNLQIDLEEAQCDSYTWMGETYSQSGDYEYLSQTSFGCDSIIHLHLTINHTPELEIVGPNEIEASTEFCPYIYQYYIVDSTEIEPNTLSWACSDPKWVITPVDSQYRCDLMAVNTHDALLYATTHNSFGCDTICSFEISASLVNVAETSVDDVVVFPNPAKSQVNVQAHEIIHIRIINALGQTMMDSPYGKVDEACINVNDLKRGLYLIEITTSQGKFTKPLTVH